MANTLNQLIPDLYVAMDVVSRELTGFIPSVTMDPSVARAAVGQPVRGVVAPAAQAEDITPGTNPPDTGDQDISNEQVLIQYAKAVPFRWTGEEQLGLNSGPGYLTVRQNQMAQAMRTLANEIEATVAANYVRASRAFGTAGTTPFGTTDKTHEDLLDLLKILKDNGCPQTDLQLVLDTTSGTNFGKIPNLFKVNEAGENSFLRQNMLGTVGRFNVRESAGVVTHARGTANAAYDLNGAAAVGATTITVDTGSGTILAGDVVALDGDAENKYVVSTALAGGDLVLNKPGIRVGIADNAGVTVGAAYQANLAFHRSAIVLATRPPALPEEGDTAIDRTLITDPRTGLTFELSMYPEYRRVRYELAIAWGSNLVKPEHAAVLLG